MRVAIYDRVEPPVPAELPLRLIQTCSQRAATAFLALVIPAALGGTLTTLAVIFQAMVVPAARAVVEQHPALGFEVLAAIGFLTYLVALPTKRLVDRLATTRTVEIAHGLVNVTEGGHFRSWTWAAPLASFSGVAHHVRASLSGTRHELILVHPEREKSVLLSVAPRTSEGEVDRVATLLGHKVIPPSELYRFKALWLRMTPAPSPDAAHA
ncbi:MAG TPA: hypothetical protein VIG38_01475 [Hyphomicrobium sp.]|jgi:hypothetical protein